MKTPAFVLLSLVLVVLGFLAPHTTTHVGTRTQTSPAEAERVRIQNHLATVERELLARDVSGLTPANQRARQERIQRLREYRLAGRFPHNHQFPGRRVPYFVDQHGTLCAMAYLIASSGARDLVDQVARSANNATVVELASDPRLGQALKSWLNASGLTVGEAQRVQPSYYEPPRASKKISVAYGACSGAAGAIGIASLAAEVSEGSRVPGWIPWVGIAMGSAGVVLGSEKLDYAAPARTLGIANIVVGAVSIVGGISALLSSPAEHLVEEAETGSRPSIWIMAGTDRSLHPVAGIRAAF